MTVRSDQRTPPKKKKRRRPTAWCFLCRSSHHYGTPCRDALIVDKSDGREQGER